MTYLRADSSETRPTSHSRTPRCNTAVVLSSMHIMQISFTTTVDIREHWIVTVWWLPTSYATCSRACQHGHLGPALSATSLFVLVKAGRACLAFISNASLAISLFVGGPEGHVERLEFLSLVLGWDCLFQVRIGTLAWLWRDHAWRVFFEFSVESVLGLSRDFLGCIRVLRIEAAWIVIDLTLCWHWVMTMDCCSNFIWFNILLRLSNRSATRWQTTTSTHFTASRFILNVWFLRAGPIKCHEQCLFISNHLRWLLHDLRWVTFDPWWRSSTHCLSSLWRHWVAWHLVSGHPFVHLAGLVSCFTAFSHQTIV